MPKVAFYLARPAAENETVIFARISYQGQRLKYYTLQNIRPAYWNGKTKRAKETAKFPQYPEFNRSLNDFVSQVDAVFDKYRSDNCAIPAPATLKTLLDERIRRIETQPEGKPTLFAFYEDFARRSMEGARVDYKSKKPIVLSTAKGYKTALNRLKEFQQSYRRKIDFNTVDLEFYNDYLKYLTGRKFSVNYIGDQVKRLKAVLHEATEKGLNDNFAFKSRYFTKPTEEVESIYLTEADLLGLQNADLSRNKRLEKVRDLFLVGCYTGLRYSDYSALRPDHIKDGIITIKQAKTGRTVAVPVHRVVSSILTKYGGKLPAAISNQKTNSYLKELAALVEILQQPVKQEIKKEGKRIILDVPKYQLIGTHTARRTFATNEYLNGTPAITIMAITGHRTEKAFLKYIKITPEGHAREMQKLWESRTNTLIAV